MNCSTPMQPEPEDFGSAFITREKDGKTVTLRARTPGSKHESKVSIPVEVWREMIGSLSNE